MAITLRQSEKIKTVTQQLEKLEAELASSRDELEKLKAVDVKMHFKRGSRIDGKSAGLVKRPRN